MFKFPQIDARTTNTIKIYEENYSDDEVNTSNPSQQNILKLWKMIINTIKLNIFSVSELK